MAIFTKILKKAENNGKKSGKGEAPPLRYDSQNLLLANKLLSQIILTDRFFLSLVFVTVNY